MKLIYPTNPYIITQKFGANANTYYSEDGLKGHTGLDLQCAYGQTITSACDGYVYSIQNKDNPDLMRYRAVYVIYDDGIDCYEVSYGHAKDILVEKGQTIKAGDSVITGGNTGDVASGGVKVTQEMKQAGSTAGTHLHFQVRKLRKVTQVKSTDWPIVDGNGKVKINGYYFLCDDRLNGYAGCIDPEQFFTSTPKHVFSKVLKLTMRDPEVKELQKALGVIQTGYFGPITYSAVRKFQLSHGLKSDGVVGPNTNQLLNI